MEEIMLSTSFVLDKVSLAKLKEGDWKTGIAGRVVDYRIIFEVEGLAAVLTFRHLLRDALFWKGEPGEDPEPTRGSFKTADADEKLSSARRALSVGGGGCGAKHGIGLQTDGDGTCPLVRDGETEFDEHLGDDLILIRLLDIRFLDGVHLSDASQLVAGVKHICSFLINKRSLALPRVGRALRGWGRLSPSAQRLPLPRSLALAVCGVLAARHLPLMALFIALSFACYFRSSSVIDYYMRV